MTQKDLVRELKSTIKELSDEKDDLLVKLRAKEGRIKQILIQLEQSTEDVAHVGKKIKEQEDEIKDLNLKLERQKMKLDEIKKSQTQNGDANETPIEKQETVEEESSN